MSFDDLCDKIGEHFFVKMKGSKSEFDWGENIPFELIRFNGEYLTFLNKRERREIRHDVDREAFEHYEIKSI